MVICSCSVLMPRKRAISRVEPVQLYTSQSITTPLLATRKPSVLLRLMTNRLLESNWLLRGCAERVFIAQHRRD